MRIILKIKYFPVADAKDNYQIYFPKDTSLKGRFFYVKKEYVTIDDKTGDISINLDANVELPIINEKEDEFMTMQWKELCQKLQRFLRQKEIEEEKNQ